MEGPIHYTTSADGTSIAWRRLGEGDVDVLWLGGFVGHLEVVLEQPRVQRFFDRLGAFASVVAYDKRGQGLSDRPDRAGTMEEHADDALAVMDAAGLERPTLFGAFASVVAYDKRGQGLSDRPDRAGTMEEHADDALAVMDAAGLERPTLVGLSEGGPAAIVCAAAHPDRIDKLVLYGTYARLLRADDYPDGVTLASLDAMRERALTNWGDPVALHGFAPSMVDDAAFGAWWARLLRLGVSRSGMRQLLDTWEHLDVRGALPSIHLPTLVMCRSTDRMTPFAWSQYLA